MPGSPDTAAVTLWMSDLLGAGQTEASVAALAVAVDVVDADLPVTALDALFRADPHLTCLAVRAPDASIAKGADGSSNGPSNDTSNGSSNGPSSGTSNDTSNDTNAGAVSAAAAAGGGRYAAGGSLGESRAGWGLLTRARFQQLMTGPLGYGRLLLARKTAQAVADWSPLVVRADTAVADIARLVVEHDASSVSPGGPASTVPIASPSAAGAGAGAFVGAVDSAEAPTAVSELLVVQAGQDVRRLSVATVFRALSAQLAVQALTDPLTGLANRDHFLQYLHRCCQQPTKREGQLKAGRAGLRDGLRDGARERLAVVYIDLDGFKAFNDSYGHSIGDRVLQVVADRLRGSCRPQDLPARLGGDEFAIVVHLPVDVPAAHAAEGLAQRVLACLGGTITVGQLVLPGRASIGVAVAGDRLPEAAGRSERGSAGDSALTAAEDVFVQADLLLREADLAMYQAKVAGGHRAQIVTGVSPRAGAGAPLVDRRELHRAMAAGEFVLHFQPIVEVRTGQLASVEALIRWQHPTRGQLGPGAFLDAVADAGFAAELDRYVVKTALGQLRVWTDELGSGAPPSVNVNLSVQGLQTAGLADAVLAAVRESGVAPDRLRLEVPEAASVQQLQVAAADLTRLRVAGVRLTLDDLGAGASTLHHLTDLALDGMKIDRRFVAGMLEDERDAAVVRMLLELGLSTGLAVTAEGVETSEQLHLLQQMARGRPVYVQGFLLGRPMPIAALRLPWPAGTQAGPPSWRGPADRRR